MPLLRAFSITVALSGLALAAHADDLAPADPYWSLVHDQAVLDDLKLSPQQLADWRTTLDPLDLACFKLQNKSAADAKPALAKLLTETKAQLGKVLSAQQTQRLDQIVVRAQGPVALLRDDLAAKLNLTDKQRTEIRNAISAARDAREKLPRDLRAAKIETAAAEKQYAKINETERDTVNASLTNDQKQKLSLLFARDFDTTKLGHTTYKAPDLVGDSKTWLNSPPLDSSYLRGRVLVVHFFAFGCSNCIHNYPTYREWQDKLAGKDVQLIGIHTPETQNERNVETLKTKLNNENLKFPVIVDNDKANWNAWGNSMWPTVYVIDRRGYLRTFWQGELKWQGATGDKQILQTIEQLLTEQQLAGK
ncbi:MAG TPA: redoxin domain-containing protein [Pirellulaceae bacterium]|jgi:thiol-disulfide isomerase/thioredoxin